MLVRMKRGFWPDLPKMQETIRDAGYKPIEDGIELRVTGKVVKQGDQLALELDGMKTPLVLTLLPAKDDPETAAHLEQKHLGKLVEVGGRWQPAEGRKGAGLLMVTEIGGQREPAAARAGASGWGPT
jgi:hypothetical protein